MDIINFTSIILFKARQCLRDYDVDIYILELVTSDRQSHHTYNLIYIMPGDFMNLTHQ